MPIPTATSGRNGRASNLTSRERWLAAAAGGVIALAAQRPARHSGLVGMAAGALLYRAISGYCPIYARAVGDRRRVQAHVIIERPPEQVFDYWRDPRHLPRPARALALGEGSRNEAHWITPAAPGWLRWGVRLHTAEPYRRLAWQAIPGSDLELTGEIQLAPVPEGTACDISLRYGPARGGLRALALLSARAERRVWDDIAQAQRALMAEAHTPRPGIDDQGLGRETLTPAHG